MSKDTTKPAQTDPEDTTGVSDSPLIAELKKQKAQKTGVDETTLPVSGIKVTWPQFKPHWVWSKAVRLSKKNPMSVTDNYLPLLCKFNGENMTVEEFKALISTDDILHLTSEVMGDEYDEEDEGNVLH
jgi:hypothetical protein